MSGPRGECDLAVVGGGILGLATARELLARFPDLDLQVLEREGSIATHQTGHNSGVIHQGVYYMPGSLKAELCVAGARELFDYCDARGIPAIRCGKVIVATGDGELPRLEELERRGRANGVPGLRRIDRDELAEIEPHAAGVAALHSPQTGIVDFAQVAKALAADVEAAGGVVAAGCAVTGIDGHAGPGGGAAAGVRITHSRGRLTASRAVFCGWVSDRDLDGLYRAGVCLAFPSLAEGFGLPVVEAMRRGLPVACANAASLPEAAGPAGHYFDPLDEGAIAQAIADLLDDDALRERLIGLGRAQAATFSWERCAEETLASLIRAWHEHGR